MQDCRHRHRQPIRRLLVLEAGVVVTTVIVLVDEC